MSYNSTQDFLIALDELPELPRGKRDEWAERVESRWIAGVFHEGREDPNTIVELDRVANNEMGFDRPVITYEVYLKLTRSGLVMSAESAIALGHHLIAAGTAAVRDMARHAWFLAGAGADESATADSAEAAGPDVRVTCFDVPPQSSPEPGADSITEWHTAARVEVDGIVGEVKRFTYWDERDDEPVVSGFEVTLDGAPDNGAGTHDIVTEDPAQLEALAAACNTTAQLLREARDEQ